MTAALPLGRIAVFACLTIIIYGPGKRLACEGAASDGLNFLMNGELFGSIDLLHYGLFHPIWTDFCCFLLIVTISIMLHIFYFHKVKFIAHLLVLNTAYIVYFTLFMIR